MAEANEYEDQEYAQEYEDDAAMADEGEYEEDDDPAFEQKLQEQADTLKEEEARLGAITGGQSAEANGEEGGTNGETASAAAAGALEENSIFVGQVDYEVTPEELQAHFASCGTINRVTILCDKFGQPKGFAYVEFLEKSSVDNAIKMDNSLLKGRALKVTRKRVNVHGFNRGGRGGFRGRGGRGRGRGGFRPRGRGYRGGFRGGYRGYQPYY